MRGLEVPLRARCLPEEGTCARITGTTSEKLLGGTITHLGPRLAECTKSTPEFLQKQDLQENRRSRHRMKGKNTPRGKILPGLCLEKLTIQTYI